MHLLLALLLPLAALAQPAPGVTGVVLDGTGAPVPNATVRLEVSGATVHEVRTTGDGRFELRGDLSDGSRVVVAAGGFAQAARDVDAEAGDLAITLEPAPFFEAVNVTSARTLQPRADPTVTVTVIPSSELLTTAAVSIDDALKMVPGFTLFRRSSSRVSNPTSQGVSLRGLGGTGPSRSLVLGDGLPLNDAFGGWVYWDKIPQAAVDRIEVQRGSGSDLYGADAVGGVIQILTLRPGSPTARALLEAGDMGTARVSLFGGSRTGGWMYSAGGEWFQTDGYIAIAEAQDPGAAPRGPIDSEVASEHRSGLMTLGYQAANGWRVDARGNVFDEDRLNGSPASINATASRQASVDVAGGVHGGLVLLRGFGGTQGYDQTFTSINAARTAETLTRRQRVPTETVGAGGQWLRPVGRHSVVVGADARQVEGTTIETPFNAQGALPTTRAGGRQRLGSAFVQATWNPGDRLTLVAGAHGSGWHTESSHTDFEKTLGAFNPRASFAYRLGDSGVTVRGSAYRGFRAPTLNEFYRGFRAGNTQTNPNEALLPERLSGADAGLQISHGRVSARITAFWNVLNDAITNVTRSITPQLITKQRANADKVRAAGLEIEADARLSRAVTATFAMGLVDSRFAGDTDLRDHRVPQVPRYNVGIGGRYNAMGWTGSAQLRVTGPQFEDDQNLFRLRRATVFDIYTSRGVGRRVQAFVAVENLFDTEYDVGRTPVLTTGLPRTLRGGLQIALP
jgi:outer membrane receptor protein involved in Fe transport